MEKRNEKKNEKELTVEGFIIVHSNNDIRLKERKNEKEERETARLILG